ncbi:MAG: DUF3492 domain-containing protein [Gracilimonas sp.]|uniref:DUF3492 domain-containing protein n=1 Tax=Gracilimonas TaxID=649462 RepID=UPI001B1F3801|nr:DUF3492 domain-containing protein [Gracilimonas sp.]MBO6586492.1 DUF3492 domain-containing protein [Gracilimonas sp.]MBO6615149.1 DUF3492 domain-containing protein [Gracilimonas sp.]
MKVLLIIEGTYPWYRGGVSEWVYRYLSHLQEFDFTILQIATDEFQGLNPSEALYPLTDNINDFIRISPPELGSDTSAHLEHWYDQALSNHTLSDSEFDLVHVTNTGFAGWLGSRLANQIDTPLLLTEHAIYWKEIEMGAVALECGYKIPEGSRDKINMMSSFKELALYTYKNAEQVVTVSESNIPYQKELGATDIIYIPNGIPASWLRSEKSRADRPVIGWVGRCAEMKNPLAFFELVDGFKGHSITPKFRMLLSDANENELEKQVRSVCKDYPEVECIWNQPAKNFFSDFDFLSITSHNESQPLVMLEALAHKALPVGFRVGDLTEKYGLVSPPGSSLEGLAGKITRLWNNRLHFNRYVNTRFERVKENHTWEQIFSDYETLMKNMSRVEEAAEE